MGSLELSADKCSSWQHTSDNPPYLHLGGDYLEIGVGGGAQDSVEALLSALILSCELTSEIPVETLSDKGPTLHIVRSS